MVQKWFTAALIKAMTSGMTRPSRQRWESREATEWDISGGWKRVELEHLHILLCELRIYFNQTWGDGGKTNLDCVSDTVGKRCLLWIFYSRVFNILQQFALAQKSDLKFWPATFVILVHSLHSYSSSSRQLFSVKKKKALINSLFTTQKLKSSCWPESGISQ